MISKLRNLSYERCLQHLELIFLEQRRLRGQLIETYKYLNGLNNVTLERHFGRNGHASAVVLPPGDDPKVVVYIRKKGKWLEDVKNRDGVRENRDGAKETRDGVRESRDGAKENRDRARENRDRAREKRDIGEYVLKIEEEITGVEIETFLKKVKNGKASGPDDIPYEFYKQWFGMDNANSVATPVDVNADLVTTSDEVEECDIDLYQSAISTTTTTFNEQPTSNLHLRRFSGPQPQQQHVYDRAQPATDSPASSLPQAQASPLRCQLLIYTLCHIST
ncbi:hypothetical protein FHG87_006490 [Trinorchestia longiramus]|nr:hypothetical protein FHG87_006490 [Trinorchestia longiramus]